MLAPEPSLLRPVTVNLSAGAYDELTKEAQRRSTAEGSQMSVSGIIEDKLLPGRSFKWAFGASRDLPPGFCINFKGTDYENRYDQVARSAARGAVALAIVGFGWGSWVTGGSAGLTAKTRSENAVVAALAPICATQFSKSS